MYSKKPYYILRKCLIAKHPSIPIVNMIQNIAGYESAWLDPVQGREFDLSVLWQMLERHTEQMKEKEGVRKNISTTWELVVVQVSSRL